MSTSTFPFHSLIETLRKHVRAVTFADPKMIDFISFTLIGHYFNISIIDNRISKTNFFTVIPGESSATSKSSALDVLMEVFSDVTKSLFSSTNGTWEFLESNPETLYVADEFTKILKDINEGKHGATGLDDLFCSLFDCPRTMEPPNYISQKRKALQDVKVSIIGLTTPRHFDNVNTDNLMTGGFFNRFLFYRAQIEDNAWDKPKMTPLQRLALDNETKFLKLAVDAIHDVVKFDIEIDDLFRDHITKQLKMTFEKCKKIKDFTLFGYMRRMQIYMLKIAAIMIVDDWIRNNYDILNPSVISGLKTNVKLILNDQTINFKEVMNYIYPSLDEFSKTSVIVSNDKNLMKIHRYLIEHQKDMPVNVREVYWANHMRRKDFSEILSSINYLHDFVVFRKDRTDYICEDSDKCIACPTPDLEPFCEQAKQMKQLQVSALPPSP